MCKIGRGGVSFGTCCYHDQHFDAEETNSWAGVPISNTSDYGHSFMRHTVSASASVKFSFIIIDILHLQALHSRDIFTTLCGTTPHIVAWGC